jgi:hypothetical protein
MFYSLSESPSTKLAIATDFEDVMFVVLIFNPRSFKLKNLSDEI